MCDLVPDDALAEMEAVTSALQPEAKIIRTQHSQVDSNEILDSGRFDFNQVSQSTE